MGQLFRLNTYLSVVRPPLWLVRKLLKLRPPGRWRSGACRTRHTSQPSGLVIASSFDWRAPDQQQPVTPVKTDHVIHTKRFNEWAEKTFWTCVTGLSRTTVRCYSLAASAGGGKVLPLHSCLLHVVLVRHSGWQGLASWCTFSGIVSDLMTCLCIETLSGFWMESTNIQGQSTIESLLLKPIGLKKLLSGDALWISLTVYIV